MSNNSKSNIVVVGSIAFDSVATPAGEVEKALGGSAVFFSSAARFFSSVRMIGVVGQDFPPRFIKLLQRLNIDTSGIHFADGNTFHWKGQYEGDLNQAQTLDTQLNVFAEFNPILNTQDRQTRHLFLGNIHPELQLRVVRQVKKPRWIACDTMNFWIESARPSLMKVFKCVDISFINDAEIRQLSGESNLLKAAKWLLSQGPSLVVVKKGEHGLLCVTKQHHFSLPAFLLDTVKDPTGAGDSFAGGFFGYLSTVNKVTVKDMKIAACYGLIIASFNVQSFSNNRIASLKKQEISNRLNLYKRSLAL